MPAPTGLMGNHNQMIWMKYLYFHFNEFASWCKWCRMMDCVIIFRAIVCQMISWWIYFFNFPRSKQIIVLCNKYLTCLNKTSTILSPFAPASSKPNCTFLAPALAALSYLAMLLIFHLTHTADTVSQMKK